MLVGDIDEISPEAIEILKQAIEQRDFLNKEVDFKNKQIEELQEKLSTSIYGVYSKYGFISEVTKKQKYCIENDIVASLFLIKMDNYSVTRRLHGVKGAEASLLDIATHLKAATKENDVIGYVFEYTFGVFVPFMNEEEANKFANSISEKINNTSHFYKNKNVPTKTSIVCKKLVNEDVSDFLYQLEML